MGMSKRKPKKLPTFLRDDEPERLLRATKTLRDRVLLMTLLMSGIRVSEASRLRVEHVDFTRGILWVRCGKGAKDRAGPIPKRLAGPLRALIAARTKGPVFISRKGNALSPRAIQELVKKTAVAAGFPDALAPRRFHPHALRGIFCVRLLEAGVPIHEVRDLMGHSSIGVTNSYANCSPGRLQDAIDRPYAS